jgi:hypothetical protein
MVYLPACVFRLLVELESTELAALRFRDTEAIGGIGSKTRRLLNRDTRWHVTQWI